MKVSVIMASFLEAYPGGAQNREKKFIRAVKSFKNQTYQDKELIIVADGCQKTVNLYEEHFKEDENINLILLPKQELYSGEMRNIAFDQVKGDLITYLDSDDVIGKTHIETIVNQFDTDKYDFVYYNDYLVTNPTFKNLHLRIVETRYGSIGTSAVTHKKMDGLKWQTGYGHDFIFIFSLVAKGMRFKKIEKNPQYLVCHWRHGDY